MGLIRWYRELHASGKEYIKSVMNLECYPQEEEEEGIKDESQFARRAQGTKKPLPFYHGNKRRF